MDFDLDDFYFERNKRLNLPDESFDDYIDRKRTFKKRYGSLQMRTTKFLTAIEDHLLAKHVVGLFPSHRTHTV